MSPIKILVADDEVEILELYRLSLESQYSVLYARDGIEAWKLFREEKPRLVVTDLNMPGINGQELTQKIRNHETLGDTPVIIITGTTKNDDLAPGFWKIGTQATQYLHKPVSPDFLLQEIRRVLVSTMTRTPLPPGKGYYDGFETSDDRSESIAH